jgi:3-hydroxybutyryl-CoA dehydrogenase
MQTVFVVGAGFMGAGIAQVCAQAGYRVCLTDVADSALEKALEGIRWSVEKLVSKGLVSGEPAAIVDRIQPRSGLQPAARSDWIIEAALEEEPLKLALFREIDAIAPAHAVLASNTSSIPISRLARATARPERFLGLHFFGPVPFMPLVEVIRGEATSQAIFDAGVQFVQSLGKTPVRVNRDIPGFVMNRIFSAAFRECVELVERGVATPEDIDAGMRLGYGWNIGPFEIADNAGLDTFVRVARSMRALGETHLVSDSEMLPRMVSEGRLGRKAGHGFYRYDPNGKKV